MTSVERAVQFVLQRQRLPEETRARLQVVLTTLVTRAQRAHPTITTDIVDFVEHVVKVVVERLDTLEPAVDAEAYAEQAAGETARLAIDDLYLAYGCLQGDVSALRELDRAKASDHLLSDDELRAAASSYGATA